MSMPTGFGKTHNVLNFIYSNYQAFNAQGRKIFFVTSLKKNLPIDSLKERFVEAIKKTILTSMFYLLTQTQIQ